MASRDTGRTHSDPGKSGAALVHFKDNRSASVLQGQLFKSINEHNKGADNSRYFKLNRTGLPDRLKSGLEGLSGYSMDDVRVHYNSGKPAQLNALAYAQGNQIHLGPGQEKHLPHEAWHVVQQKQGRVRTTMQLKGGVKINDDQSLEREADVMGDLALCKKSNTPLLTEHSLSILQPTIQAKWLDANKEYYTWDEVNEHGIQWYSLKSNGNLFFKIEESVKVPEDLIQWYYSNKGIANAKSRDKWLQIKDVNWSDASPWIDVDFNIIRANLQPEIDESLTIDANIIAMINSVNYTHDDDHVYLVRFFNDFATANSKYRQARRRTELGDTATPSRAKLLILAREHMFEGKTEDSSFVSFTEDIAEFLKALNQQEKSKIVAQIVKGVHDINLYKTHKGSGVFRSPAKYIGVWRVNKDQVVSWREIDSGDDHPAGKYVLSSGRGAGKMLAPSDRRKRITGLSNPSGESMIGTKSSLHNEYLKKNFKEEKEAVVYSPAELIEPVAVFGNPYYLRFMESVNSE